MVRKSPEVKKKKLKRTCGHESKNEKNKIINAGKKSHT